MSTFEERLSAYLGGDLDASARLAFEDEVLADPEKSEELATMVNLDAALREVLATAGGRRPSRRWWRVAAPLAAAAVLVFVLWPGGGEIMRGGADGAADITPDMRGDTVRIRNLSTERVTEVGQQGFAWSSDPAAVQYRVEFWHADGTPLSTVLVSGTMLSEGQPGYPEIPAEGVIWQVTPIRANGREGDASRLFRHSP